MFELEEERLLELLNNSLPFSGFIKRNSEGINDRNDSLFYIEEKDKEISFQNEGLLYTASKEYKIIVQTGTFNITQIAHNLLTILRQYHTVKKLTTDSEAIYLSETNTKLQKSINLLRIIIEITTIEHENIENCITCVQSHC